MLDIKILKLFHQDKILAENIDLRVDLGDKIVVSGPTGCGKSSLLQTLNLFNFDYQGTILYKNKILQEYSPCTLRGQITYLMQEPYLPPGQTKNIFQEALNFKCKKHLTINQQVLRKLFTTFKLDHSLLSKQVKQLSGGEKQRIALINSLLLKPQIILLDEPSSALDKHTSQIVADWLLSQKNLTVIAISHDAVWQESFPKIWNFSNRKVIEQRSVLL